MKREISLAEFLVDGEDFIKDAIVNSPYVRLEDHDYYYHFNYDEDTSIITTEDTYINAEFTVFAPFDDESDEFWRRIAEMHGLDYEQDPQSVYDSFDISDIEESAEFADDFDHVCTQLYNKVLDKII